MKLDLAFLSYISAVPLVILQRPLGSWRPVRSQAATVRVIPWSHGPATWREGTGWPAVSWRECNNVNKPSMPGCLTAPRRLPPSFLSLNNIAHHIKHSDSPGLANSYGALDLSNDEAQHPSQVLPSGFKMMDLSDVSQCGVVSVCSRRRVRRRRPCCPGPASRPPSQAPSAGRTQGTAPGGRALY
jgi:hypothetical protein